MQSQMQFRTQKRGYSVLVMIASPLLALALAGVAWASVCTPGLSTFLEIDQPSSVAGQGNVGFDSEPMSSFDWANSGANSPPCGISGTSFCTVTGAACSSTLPCTGGESCLAGHKVSCSGSGGIFDGGVFFNDTTQVPIAPPVIASNPTIAAATFGVDPLSTDTHVLVVPYNKDPTLPAVVDCGTGDPTVYTGKGGEVNGDRISSETFGTGSVPNKDEISNAYAIDHIDPVNADLTTCAGCVAGMCSSTCLSNANCTATSEVYAGFERVVNNGDSHVDLEFLQQEVSLVPNTSSKHAASLYPCSGSFSGHRSQGDFLLSVDFTTGGTFGTQVLYKWSCAPTSPTPVPQGTVCDPLKGQCSGSTTPPIQCSVDADCPGTETCNRSKTGPQYVQTACTSNECREAVDNLSAVGCGGWGCRNATGVRQTTLLTNDFYEGGIDLAAIGFTGCISSFLPHTRSSQSFTATLKDFQLLKFNTCKPTTRLTKTVCETGSSTNCGSPLTIITGGSATYTYTEKNDNTQDVPLTSPCGITGFTSACCTSAGSDLAAQRSCFVTDDKCSGVTYQSGDTNNNNTLDKGETWTFTCTLNNITAPVTNTALGHGNFNDQDVTFCSTPASPPAHTFCDQDEKASATVLVVKPDTCLKKSAKVTKTETTVLYTYDEKNEGTVSLSSPSVNDDKCGAATLQTCVSGTCSSGTGSCTANHDCSGDTNDNGVLDPGETFHFQCTKIFTGSGSTPFNNTAVSHGCFTAGGVTKDVTASSTAASCGKDGIFFDGDEMDMKSVTVPNPTISGGKSGCP